MQLIYQAVDKLPNRMGLGVPETHEIYYRRDAAKEKDPEFMVVP
jgi:hypothetical protein